jgi:hypothetical protein
MILEFTVFKAHLVKCAHDIPHPFRNDKLHIAAADTGQETVLEHLCRNKGETPLITVALLRILWQHQRERSSTSRLDPIIYSVERDGKMIMHDK